jgi:hypothetical protein
MKKLLTLIGILTVATLATSSVRADNTVASDINSATATVTNTVAEAQATLLQAQKSLALAEALVSHSTNDPSTNAVVSSTNSAAVTSTNSTFATAKTTINDEVVLILQGVNKAGGDIYNASKSAITQAVDFTAKETPIVVTEFLHWKLAEAVIYFVAWCIPVFFLFYVASRMGKRAKSPEVPENDKHVADKSDYTIGKWIFSGVALILLMINVMNYGMTITKICVAPRVYLIEYVVNAVQAAHNGSANN